MRSTPSSVRGAVDLRTGEVDPLLGPMEAPISDPDWSPDARQVVAIDNDLHLVDPATSDTRLISPERTWSRPHVVG